jgi:LysR family hydrogen peroxide-inducible transcriptional activator
MSALPSLKQLRYLIALAETGHFGRAAEKCFITQPSLSAAIADLEGILGAQLVERNKRQVLITPLGEEVVARSRDIVTQVEELSALAHASTAPLTGPLSLGVIPTIGPYLLPDLMNVLRDGFPKLRPFLREDQTHNLIDLLRAGKIDLALLALPIEEPWLEEMHLFDDPFVYAGPPSHPLSKQKEVSVQDLANEKLLLLEDGHCLRDQALEVCSTAGRKRGIDFEANSLSTLVQMVLSGVGVTLLPQMSLVVEARAGTGLAVRPFTGSEPVRRIGLVWRRSSGRKAEFRELGSHLKKHLPALCAPAPK